VVLGGGGCFLCARYPCIGDHRTTAMVNVITSSGRDSCKVTLVVPKWDFSPDLIGLSLSLSA